MKKVLRIISTFPPQILSNNKLYIYMCHSRALNNIYDMFYRSSRYKVCTSSKLIRNRSLWVVVLRGGTLGEHALILVAAAAASFLGPCRGGKKSLRDEEK